MKSEKLRVKSLPYRPIASSPHRLNSPFRGLGGFASSPNRLILCWGMKKREPNDVDPRFCVYQVRLFAVVWCLHGDVHVVWMALEETGVGDAHEDALLLEGGDVG